jgi:acyl-CoA reductase-like NAD-dependent aldehyde dehydrogenase
VSNHARRGHRPGAARGRAELAAALGLPANALQPVTGELQIGVPIVEDGRGGQWMVTGSVGQRLREELRNGCAECAGGDHDHGSG